MDLAVDAEAIVKAGYHTLSLKCHPDRFPKADAQAMKNYTEKFQELENNHAKLKLCLTKTEFKECIGPEPKPKPEPKPEPERRRETSATTREQREPRKKEEEEEEIYWMLKYWIEISGVDLGLDMLYQEIEDYMGDKSELNYKYQNEDPLSAFQSKNELSYGLLILMKRDPKIIDFNMIFNLFIDGDTSIFPEGQGDRFIEALRSQRGDTYCKYIESLYTEDQHNNLVFGFLIRTYIIYSCMEGNKNFIDDFINKLSEYNIESLSDSLLYALIYDYFIKPDDGNYLDPKPVLLPPPVKTPIRGTAYDILKSKWISGFLSNEYPIDGIGLYKRNNLLWDTDVENKYVKRGRDNFNLRLSLTPILLSILLGDNNNHIKIINNLIRVGVNYNELKFIQYTGARREKQAKPLYRHTSFSVALLCYKDMGEEPAPAPEPEPESELEPEPEEERDSLSSSSSESDDDSPRVIPGLRDISNIRFSKGHDNILYSSQAGGILKQVYPKEIIRKADDATSKKLISQLKDTLQLHGEDSKGSTIDLVKKLHSSMRKNRFKVIKILIGKMRRDRTLNVPIMEELSREKEVTSGSVHIPLTLAITLNLYDVVEELIGAGIDVTRETYLGKPLLEIAWFQREGQDRKILKLLIERGCDFNIPFTDGRYLLDHVLDHVGEGGFKQFLIDKRAERTQTWGEMFSQTVSRATRCFGGQPCAQELGEKKKKSINRKTKRKYKKKSKRKSKKKSKRRKTKRRS